MWQDRVVEPSPKREEYLNRFNILVNNIVVISKSLGVNPPDTKYARALQRDLDGVIDALKEHCNAR